MINKEKYYINFLGNLFKMIFKIIVVRVEIIILFVKNICKVLGRLMKRFVLLKFIFVVIDMVVMIKLCLLCLKLIWLSIFIFWSVIILNKINIVLLRIGFGIIWVIVLNLGNKLSIIKKRVVKYIGLCVCILDICISFIFWEKLVYGKVLNKLLSNIVNFFEW